ncbi:Holliday junction resolvase RuvX [Candidatus Pantoea edessiphila]|uniref:Putative pre-16S rRNA nuclease n=1 Tax=Candidatus Pantoea edessiphila TaxID=2044610 RepID=A0A2P5SXX3_9GAMM|nr:Holliday junction resolvase RuvX [Candidatus Pantoea edessiphila]MBK4775754.1 Holliday junction resolvase RuvX [Pantoea sp. Edef]PPI87150.1 Holliday junction resolvase RuvX [Candidatus Pantoea edessiphila]
MYTKIILAFDFGKKNIGVAIGQLVTGIASPISALKAKEGIPNWIQIEKLIKKWQPSVIIVGLPLNMDGTEQYLTYCARKFANNLNAKFSINTYMQDERLSTREACSELFKCGGYRSLSKNHIDSKSAAIILQDWINNSSCNN